MNSHGAKLEIEKLEIHFGLGTPVRDASFTIDSAQSVGVVGESGSGKSLTALAIMGLLPPHAQVSGQILWNGKDLLKASSSERREIRGREIAMIFQDPMSSLNPSFTVGFQIEEVLRLRLGLSGKAARRERGLQLLGEVGLPAPSERWNAYPHQLSGGMSQRVSIAMALAGEPKLLIADEPTTALDVTVQMQILELLARLKRTRGMSLLFVTHDLAVASRVCDDVVVFYAGCTVERAPAELLLASPRHPYTQALLRARPQVGAPSRTRLQSIEGSVPRASEVIRGCVFASRCQKVFDRCRQERPARYCCIGSETRSAAQSTSSAFASCFLIDTKTELPGELN
jgi:oligopeptide/dipeptide ABC transporter ATP-binding protein